MGYAPLPAGSDLWHCLVERLALDMILISVARRYHDLTRFPKLGAWETVYTIDRHNPFSVEALRLEVLPGKSSLLVFGRAANLPFGTVSAVDKRPSSWRQECAPCMSGGCSSSSSIPAASTGRTATATKSGTPARTCGSS